MDKETIIICHIWMVGSLLQDNLYKSLAMWTFAVFWCILALIPEEDKI